MAATEFIAAIELGSSKITGIVGRRLPDNSSIQVLATASENASGCIRKGVIYNLDKTTLSLTSIIRKLESTLKASIGKVYIGMGGQSLRTIRNTEVRHMEEEIKISQELIDELKDCNRNVSIVGYEILGVAPQEYKVGNDFLTDPVGVQTAHIEGRFLNIIARKSLKQNIISCCEAAKIGIAEDAEDMIAPLALANAVLTPGERRSGCVLVDFGADTTTVSIYKNNILRHLAVIPLGGNNITKDICSQQIEEEDAEAFKIQYGKAFIDPNVEVDENKVYTLENKSSIQAILLEDIVEARVNEILDNVLNQIVLSGYESKLMAGAILTGGGANLSLMAEAFKARTKIDKVKIATDSQIVLKGIDTKKEGISLTLIALLASGKENCSLAMTETPVVKPEPKRGATYIEQTIFQAQEEEEEERKRQEEKERIFAANQARKEEEELRKRKRAECEELIQEAVKLKTDKKFKEALKKLNKAKSMNIPEKEMAISELEKELKNLIEENGFINVWMRKLSDLIGED